MNDTLSSSGFHTGFYIGGGKKIFGGVTMWCAMHAALLGGSGGMPPQENFEKIAVSRLNLVGLVYYLSLIHI